MKTLIVINVIALVVAAVGSTKSSSTFKTIKLKSKQFDGFNYTAALTRISNVGDMFWIFWSSNVKEPTSRPVIMWLEGITGVPPSLRANLETLGPLNIDLKLSNDSWVNYFNILLVDSPIGTGYSKANDASKISTNFDDHVDYLVNVVQSFYELHKEYENSPLYVFGQTHGAQFAVALGARLAKVKNFRCNIVGVGVGNGIISVAPSLSKMGYFLETIRATDSVGRCAIDDYSYNITQLINNKQYENAFDLYLSIDKFVNEKGGAVAFDLTNAKEKATREPRGYFGGRKSDPELYTFMEKTLPSIIGLNGSVKYDSQRESAVQAFRNSLMKPAIDKVENLLKNTNVTLIIYNGNQDAVLNTAGQVQWVEKLQWPGQKDFLKAPRTTLVRDGYLFGHVRKTSQLQFYWLRYTGQEVPYDLYYGLTRVIQLIANTSF